LVGQSTCKKCLAGKISKRIKQISSGTCENCGKYTSLLSHDTCACINYMQRRMLHVQLLKEKHG
jgi:hypothetical protein